jgi:arylsulfatase A-like enzyme
LPADTPLTVGYDGSVSRGMLIAFGLAALLAGSLLGQACSPAPSPSTGAPRIDRVILVSIDSLRPDHLGAYGYAPATSPFIDELARDGLVFTRAYSTTSWTLPAHVALLTGLDDYAHGVTDAGFRLSESVPTIAEELGRAGIRSSGFFSGPFLHPSFGLARGFDEYIDCTSYAWQGIELSPWVPHDRSHDDVTNPILLERIGSWLSSRAGVSRDFVFIHMWDVHYDYIAPDSYVELFDPDYTGSLTGRGVGANQGLRGGLAERDRQHLVARYDAEIRYTDDTLREILRMFEERGLLRHAAVIVTSDHGEETLDHGRWGHGVTLFEEVLRIPLILTIPGYPPARASTEEVVSLVDLFATLCDLLGAACDYRGAGSSLLPHYLEEAPPATRGNALAELETSVMKRDLSAIIRGDGKLVRSEGSGRIRYFELGSADAPERAIPVHPDRLDRHPPEVAELLRLLDERAGAERRRGVALRGTGERPSSEIDPATREQLRSLGYLE